MVTLLAFVGGHLAVVVTVLAVLYMLHRDSPLEARRAAVLELTHRPARLDAGRAELTRTRADQASVNRDLARNRQRLTDWLPLDDTPGSPWKFAIVAGLLAELEAILFLLYGVSSGFGNAPNWLLASIAPPAAVTTILLMQVMLASAFGSQHRPARTLRRARVGTVVGLIAVILAIWAVLGGRNLTDPNTIEAITGLGLIMLASTTSLTGGFAALVATTLLEEKRLERDIARLEARIQHLDEHYERVATDVSRLGGDSSQPPSGGFAAPSAIVPVLLVTLFLGTAISASAKPGTTTPTFSRTGACELLLDQTASVDSNARQRALIHLREELPVMVEGLGCKLVRVVPFANGPLLDLTEIAIPSVIDAAIACRDAAAAPASAMTNTTALLYPRVRAARARQARDNCEVQLASGRQEQLAARQYALARVASVLEQAAESTPRGNCTALILAVRRALQRAQHIVVLTDGQNSCPTPAASAALENNATLLFLLVASTNESGDISQAQITRIATVDTTFPGSHALLVPELTPSFWKGPRQ